MGLVVLPVGTAAREGEFLLLTPADQVRMEKLAAVIRVDPQERHGQPRPGLLERGEYGGLALAPDAHALRPARGDVGPRQTVQVEAGGRGPTVGDQVNLHEAGPLLV